ncbi:NFX1-type zinc finger-containing protein 1 [Acropora cervicornis]|uniref:NFX1-type zinc finger-containing protein 1 n=1 Tax=Acropora cervicornis TaxID=6130 RepID=A0AAD9QHM8_ACRCE|nr:NFX1-type zinc finger-containing protein 1 [Acropora cervicornis]
MAEPAVFYRCGACCFEFTSDDVWQYFFKHVCVDDEGNVLPPLDTEKHGFHHYHATIGSGEPKRTRDLSKKRSVEKAKCRRTQREADERTDNAPKPISFTALERICKNEFSEKAILELVGMAERFDALLCSEEIRPDLLKLVITSFRLLCSSNRMMAANTEKILRSTCTNKFMTGQVLSRFINTMPYSGDTCFDSVIDDLSVVFKAMIQRAQRGNQAILYDLPIPQLSCSFASLKQKNLIENVDDLEKKLHEVSELREKMICLANSTLESDAEPPQNFRSLSIVPDAADLLCSKPFLRKNIIDGKFNDLEHYLDVQFRLLREDFVMPLRRGIRQMRKESDSSMRTKSTDRPKRPKDVSVYHEVTILHPVFNDNGRFYRLKFDQSHRSVKNVRWERSSRLKFGSLVCLSPDDFDSVVFATVENRNANSLSVGELEVRFVNLTSTQIYQFIHSKVRFVMIESPAYFEAYRHVLEALKTMKTEEFPFKRYIVDCCQVVDPPEYLVQVSDGAIEEGEIMFDFSSVSAKKKSASLSDGDPFRLNLPGYAKQALPGSTDVNSEEEIVQEEDTHPQGHHTSGDIADVAMATEIPSEIFKWPDRESLGFNESQMRAFKLALTKQFAVIQGPPGTGKTFVAIVRIGERSRSKKLEQCALKARKFALPAWNGFRARSASRREVRAKKNSLTHSSLLLNAARSSVISLDVFKAYGCIRDADYAQFQGIADQESTDLDGHLLQWLEIKHKRDLREENDDREEDLLMELVAPGRRFTDDGRLDRDADAIREVAAISITEADNPGYVKRNLLSINDAMTEAQEKRVRDVEALDRRDRWKLYCLWRQRLEQYHHKVLEEQQESFDEAVSRSDELRKLQECAILEKARVIGMTTTCAAKYRHVLDEICPKIVLIEEAAEVLEAHIITSLTKGCQHLILIGDHQQLRPTPAVSDLPKTYKLDVSLFERMVNVGVYCERLSVQHRMRPEIASLMRHIYEGLENHESVKQYEDIKGVKKNVFFVNHSHLEDHSNESNSYSNNHEAKFLVALCRYLLQQGYEAKQVTLLTTYSGQMFAIRDCLKEQKNEELGRVRLSTVDNFQGEESDIVLLSLVRSNQEEKVGFIKVVNRTCVALSRAKKGFYCIGNFDLLSKHSELWKKIVNELKANDGFGAALPLVCQLHNDEVTAESSEDFEKKVPEGGCLRGCGVRLECGHACKQRCHPRDVKHKKYVCIEPCQRYIKGCTQQHLCPRLCNEPCAWSCAVEVEKQLPDCGHVAKVQCSRWDLENVPCQERCSKVLKCGHKCQNHCKKPCTTKCQELVKKTDWPCGHQVTIACHATQDDCPVPCDVALECGHKCSGTCGECRMGRIQKRCKLRCGRVLVCSHVCKEACGETCPPCTRKCENCCEHSKCDKMCSEPCVSCKEKCSWKCQHHECSKRCHEVCDRPRCNEPCQKTTPCCPGVVCQGLMCEENHECICVFCTKNDGKDPITEIFLGGEGEEDARFIRLPDCGHIFAVSDLDRFMDMQDDTAEENVIQIKRCPRCRTSIRLSLRYGSIIKQQLRDIEKVKMIMRQKTDQGLSAKKNKLRDRVNLLSGGQEDYIKVWKPFLSKVKNCAMAAKLENRILLMERIVSLTKRMRENPGLPENVCQENNFDVYHLESDLSFLVKRFMSVNVTQRELHDISAEISRIKVQIELCLLSRDVRRLETELDEPSLQTMAEVRNKLSSGKRIEEEVLDEMLRSLANIRKTSPELNPLTLEEKKEIVSAIGLSKGHWFKCPRGHIYCIGECGGAMERSKCPECKAVIGGERHTLEEGNTLASEMDGAQYAAWSEQANMRNYVFQ